MNLYGPKFSFVVVVLFMAGSASVWATSSFAANGFPSERNLTRFFESVVFGAEYGDVTRESAIVKKWKSPLRISVSAMNGKLAQKAGGGRELKLKNVRAKPAHVASIQAHLRVLIKLTGIVSEDAKKVGKSPNYFIKFVPALAMHLPSLIKGASPQLLKRLAAPRVCYFVTAANRRGEIVQATIVVNNQMTDQQINSCLLEEMTQTLGLPNDSDIVKPSVFNNKSVLNKLTRNDLIVVGTLYDERLTPGMERKKAVTKAASIIGDVLKRLQQ